MSVTHINPPELAVNPAFSQGTRIKGELLIVGGQNGVDSSGQVVSDDLGEQTKQALRNVLAVLAAAGADQTHVAKLNIYMLGSDAAGGYAAAAEVWGQHPTAITVLQVAGFARPEVLVEIDALAVVPS